jgi:hypothetical protein
VVEDIHQDDHGNEPSNATVLIPDNFGILGKINYQNDLDVFKVDLFSDQDIVVRISDLAFGMDPLLRIIGEDGISILEEASLQSSSSEEGYLLFPLSGLADQDRVFIEVSHKGVDEGGLFTISAGGKIPSEESQPSTGGIVPPNRGGSLVFIIILLVVGAGTGYAILSKKKRSSGTAAKTAWLVASNGITYPLQDRTIIGRSSEAHIKLADKAVSRRHTLLRYSEGAWFLQDLGSSGGTFVNDRPVQAQRLQNGDRIRIGNTTLSFQSG